MDEKLKAGVDTVFSERRKFIVVGLTGRTGSGCTTVADFLTKGFSELAPPRPSRGNYKDDEARKYKIVYDYASTHWDKFYKIRIRDIITSFILEHPFEELEVFCKEYFESSYKLTFNNIAAEFNDAHLSRIKVKENIETNEEQGIVSELAYKFYFETLNIFTDSLRLALNDLENNGFTKVYQRIANNIRNSGNAYCSKFMPKNISRLAQRTNALVKILRKRSKRTSGNVCIVIDSIRNPYEASFFKDRYSSFYLWAITTKEEDRKKRLRISHNLNESQIIAIDKSEYPKKLKGHKKFSSINLQDCIQQADVHIYNKEDGETDYSRTKRKILKYISLVKHPGLITPTRDERLMQIAFNAKVNSGCISRQVGAVVTDKYYSVKAIGWNNSAQGQVPCLLGNGGGTLLKN
jgi:dephospho-CoA kinase